MPAMAAASSFSSSTSTSATDPVESLLVTIRDALAPLESGVTRAARDLESRFHHWRRPKSVNPNHDVIFVAGSNGQLKMKKSKKKKQQLFVSDLFESKEEASSTNRLQFAVTWSVLLHNFVHGFNTPFKSVKKCFSKPEIDEKLDVSDHSCKELKPESKKAVSWNDKGTTFDALSVELLLCIAVDSLAQNFQVFDFACNKESVARKHEKLPDSSKSLQKPAPQFDPFRVMKRLVIGKKADFDGFLSNLGFARVGGPPASLVDPATATSVSEESSENVASGGGGGGEREESDTRLPQKLASGLLNIPLSNVERLRSTLSAVSLTELIEFIPHLGGKSGGIMEHPDKKKLFSVQDFFRYAEAEGKRFFDELDRDGDGRVTLEDLEIAMRKRKLPRRYARDFLSRTRSNFFLKSFGWKQFLTLMEQKEPTILRAYTTLCLSKSGTLQKNQILTSLQSAGLPANEDNAIAMMRYLNADSDGSISYGHFRNFMLLLPSKRLEDDPRSIWFEAATLVAVPAPVEISAGSVLKSALAGGLASALSTSVMHPVDSMKTRLQASSLSFPELISMLPHIGVRGLYRGSVPAILGQFSSHGLRTGIFEASKLVLVSVAPSLPDIQVQSLASACSTVLGTAVRIPCEVLKQRLQAGLFDNVGEAIVGTMRQDGLKGFFRGTGATLCREVPFYVAGLTLYAEAKKAAQHLLKRDLEPWETVAVGALSGGLAAVVTTPFDVMKTRTMTAPQGMRVTMRMVAFSILRKEGPLGLFKGAIPRFFWIAPLGAMNFAGYELAKKAMVRSEDEAGDEMHEKKLAGSGG